MRRIIVMGVVCLAVWGGPLLSVPAWSQVPLEFQQDDTVVFLGNTYAERMRDYGYFETFLRGRFPEHNLQFRNLGWSADEVSLRPRPMNFGDIHTHLTDLEADVVFLFYGMNESFAGEAGREDFRLALTQLIDDLRSHQYNGARAPRLVQVSPVPQEPVKGMPEVASRNADIERYTETMEQVAVEKELPFVNLYANIPRLQSMGDVSPLTFNGIHYEAYGYWLAGQVMAEQLGQFPSAHSIVVDLDEDRFQAIGMAVRDHELTDTGFRLTVEGLQSPYPPPPEDAPVETPLRFHGPLMIVKGLAPGKYGVAYGNVVVALGTHQEWARGIRILDAPFQSVLEEARLESVHKNRLFFDRWRAVNGFYIYGGRKEPFGVQSFPPELTRFDERVAEEEAAINGRMKGFFKQTLTFARVED